MHAPHRTLLDPVPISSSMSLDPSFEPANVMAQIAGMRPRGGRLARAAAAPRPTCRAIDVAGLPTPPGPACRHPEGTRRGRTARQTARAPRIDRVGLGRPPDRLRKRAHLPRIDDRDRQCGGGTLRHRDRLHNRPSLRRRSPTGDGHQPRHQRPDRARRRPTGPGVARLGTTAMVRVALLTSIPMLRSICTPGRRGSRPYACPGSWPYQLSGMNDDVCERAPLLTFGVGTWRSCGSIPLEAGSWELEAGSWCLTPAPRTRASRCGP